MSWKIFSVDLIWSSKQAMHELHLYQFLTEEFPVCNFRYLISIGSGIQAILSYFLLFCSLNNDFVFLGVLLRNFFLTVNLCLSIRSC